MRRIVFCLVAAALTIAPVYAQTDALEWAERAKMRVGPGYPWVLCYCY